MDFLKKILPRFVLIYYHMLWPFLGAVIYGRPGKKIKVIGITGTNGKTTVTHLATDILEAAGYKVASISSLRFKVGEQEWKNELKMTMPGRMKLQKFLRQAVNAGCDYVVMEVTSEGIKQYRHKFIDFDVAVFTNLTPEHIESHGSFENYKKAKGELFKIAKSAIINLDDENSRYFSDLCKGKKYGYSTKQNDMSFKLALLGEFNLSNALAAAYVGLSQGVDKDVIRRSLESSRVIPGRMEVVSKNPTVIVDYAHTPDALEKVYKAVGNPKSEILNSKQIQSSNSQKLKLICVLGSAGGGRDKWKRPKMGKIAAHYCDSIILTNEDPYDEDPESIISQIESGVRSEISCEVCDVLGQSQAPQEGHKKILTILDRREAIKKALQIAKSKDTVIITGKGAEPWMMTKDGKVPWDDREIVRSFLDK